MSIATAASGSSAVAAPSDFTIETVTSPDGASIGVRRIGTGPGLILLHGSMSTGAHHTELARLLADVFTVIVPDRRGRGLSGPWRGNPGLREELSDVVTLLDATGARNIWGLSSGACLALQAARRRPEIERIAIFEPPLVRDRSSAEAILRVFDAEMARGKIAEAMVTAMRGAEMGPGWMRALPKPILALIVGMGMGQEAKRPPGPYPSMRELAPALHADFAIVAGSSGHFEEFRSIRASVLLMGGSKSQLYLRRALDGLEQALPNARRVELEGVDHGASWNRDARGNPGPVATELRRFFG